MLKVKAVIPLKWTRKSRSRSTDKKSQSKSKSRSRSKSFSSTSTTSKSSSTKNKSGSESKSRSVLDKPVSSPKAPLPRYYGRKRSDQSSSELSESSDEDTKTQSTSNM